MLYFHSHNADGLLYMAWVGVEKLYLLLRQSGMKTFFKIFFQVNLISLKTSA